MFHVPLTFYFDFERVSETARPFIMHEFKSCGAEHLVLSDALFSLIFSDPTLIETLMKEVEDAGLTFVDAHAPFGKFTDLICPLPEYREQLVMRQQMAIRIAAQMGVDTVTVHGGNDTLWPGLTQEQGRANIIAALERILPTAEECGVTVCLENTWRCCVLPDALLEIKKHFPTDAFGFCYDSGHANICAKGGDFQNSRGWESWKFFGIQPQWEEHTLEKMLPHIVNCHLHDNDGILDQHRIPGCGNVDWRHELTLLRKAPRLKNIQCEVIPVRVNDSISDICRKFRELGELD